MSNELNKILMTLSIYMDASVSKTINIIELAEQGRYDEIPFEVDNRDRILKIMQKFNEVLGAKVQTFPANIMAKLNKEILNDWRQDLQNWNNRLNYLDEKLTHILTSAKESTKIEIKSIHETHQKFQGYNLKSTK